MYHLAIACLSTLRNWVSEPAFRVSRFMLSYRLAGTLVFEGCCSFPEYFFIAYR